MRFCSIATLAATLALSSCNPAENTTSSTEPAVVQKNWVRMVQSGNLSESEKQEIQMAAVGDSLLSSGLALVALEGGIEKGIWTKEEVLETMIASVRAKNNREALLRFHSIERVLNIPLASSAASKAIMEKALKDRSRSTYSDADWLYLKDLSSQETGPALVAQYIFLRGSQTIDLTRIEREFQGASAPPEFWKILGKCLR